MKLSTAHLSPKARELVGHIGLPATLRLVDAWGGRVVQIPRGKRVRGEALLEELAEIVGGPAARTLSRVYGGEYLGVPLCDEALRITWYTHVQGRFDALTAEGNSARAAVARIVTEERIHERTVWRILKRPAGEQAVMEAAHNEDQLDLFET